MYWYCHVMWRSVMKAALVPSNVKPFNHVTWHWTSDSYFICTCMFFVLSSILLVYICIYIYTLVQPMLYIYTSVERYYTHILYHFSHIYLCAFGHVDFISQNTRLWNITQCNVLDYTMHDLPRPSHICFFSLQSDTAGYCAALYFGMQKYLILIHPIRARQWSSPLRSHEISCLVIWHDTTWHEMTWHDIHDEICCNINITAELLCQKWLHGPVWLTLGGAFCSFWWSWRITSFAHCFQRIS